MTTILGDDDEKAKDKKNMEIKNVPVNDQTKHLDTVQMVGKRKKMIMIAVGVVVFIVALTLTLVFTLGGKKSIDEMIEAVSESLGMSSSEESLSGRFTQSGN
jgi:flagellar basal body-associated protein FliL